MNKPKIVVFCGSSKFVDIMAVAAWLVEREEKAISMGLHLLPEWYRSPTGELPAHHLAEHEGVADEMDELHKRKIDMCNEIFVININDYIGSSTMSEIEYAMNSGKNIRWYSSDPVGRQVDEMIQAAIAAKPSIQGESHVYTDQWYVAKKYFEENFEPMEES
jgi:hypothetical protein